MINKSNDLPSFVNENNLPKIVDKLSNASNIKITGNKYGNRVQAVIDKIVEKADDVTKAIKQEVVNNSYSFKVGTGDVDVSADVEDGFGEVGVKGVTYQNLWNINKVNGATIEGNTVKVLASANNYKFCGIYLKDSCLKPNTTYTLITNVFENTLDGRFNPCIGHSSSVFKKNAKEFQAKTTGVSMSVLTTTSTFTTEDIGIRTIVLNDCTEGFIKYNMLILEGDHTNNPNLPSYFEGIVGVGDKSKNLFNGKNVSIGYLTATGAINASGTTCRVTDYIEVKSNTSYTVNNPANETHCFYDSNKNFISYVGARTFITPINCKYVRCTIKRADYDNTFQLEEGSTSTSYEHYYDGHKIEILSHGKNLVKPTITYNNNKFDTVLVSTINQCLYLNGIKEQGKSPGDSLFTNSTDYFYLKPNTKYIVSRKIFSGESNLCILAFRLENVTTGTIQWLNTGSGENCVINASSDIRRVSYFRIYHDPYLKIEYKNVVVGAMMEEVKEQQTTRSNYEPYVSDKTQILLDEPLMRLPNGTCDEITRDGKLIRRVGKVVLDGSENWKTKINLDGLTYRYSLVFKFKTSDNYDNVDNIICNDLATKSFSNIYYNGEKGITTWWSNDYIIKTIVICLSNNYSLEQFKEWLSQNPITVYYELETPIITELPAPYLRIFKDGHLTFNTLVAPESNHVVQINKSAQIERSIREVQSLDGRVGKLESFYDDMMLETSHKLSLLNYDFEYTRERNGE